MMKRKSAVALAALLVAFLVVPSVAGATTVTWDFSSPSGDVGSTSHTYLSSPGGVAIPTTGYNGGNLYGKALGGDENGLGFVDGPNNEISGISEGEWVQLDLNALLGGGYNNFKFAMNSSTGNDSWNACFGAISGTFGSTACQTGTNEGLNGPVGFGARYFDVQATSGDVLLEMVQADTTSVPEPASLFLLGTGVIAGARRWRKRQANA